MKCNDDSRAETEGSWSPSYEFTPESNIAKDSVAGKSTGNDAKDTRTSFPGGQSDLLLLLSFRNLVLVDIFEWHRESVAVANTFEMADQVIGFLSEVANCTLSSTTHTNQSKGGTTGTDAHEESTLIYRVGSQSDV
ncbi:hypothetical protein Syun_007112 [Stephania yunnanensis]|uniref:Uncharacterized protein n=1 Tax=Stephania yunnanensis TaxID=152371 RepID=A0AAP0KY76_9MAGN